MNLSTKLISLILVSLLTLSVTACSTSTIKTAQQSKSGFSNITDIPLPETANIDLNKSMVMGGGNTWTGHLVYYTNKSQEQVIDFVTTQMSGTGWTKLSELRGNESVITYIKEKRVATVRVTTDKGLLIDKTIVAIDMTHANLSPAQVNAQPENA